jgi:hypothetical protein
VMDNERTPASFHRNQNLNFWMQVYNLGIDDKSKKNGATLQYEIVEIDSNKTVLDSSEDSKSISPNADQVTVEHTVPLASLLPGKYRVTIKVNDSVKKQQIAESAPFTVD